MKLTDFGESHGPAIGGVITEVPPGKEISKAYVQRMLDRRRPGSSVNVSARRESDEVEFLSGISPEGITLGTPIGFLIRNIDARSRDYKDMEGKFRPNHADYTWWKKYGIIDWRGSGRSSGRLTACTVVAGAIAKQMLEKEGISVDAYVSAVGRESLSEPYSEQMPLCVSPEMLAEVERARMANDSVGGIVSCRIRGVPVGLGRPTEDKLQASLAQAMMSIGGTKGFEYGDGFASAGMCGSECVDIFDVDESGKVFTLSNHSGGIQGGLSNGADILFSVAFKPTATIGIPLPTIDIHGERCMIEGKGRHDACIALRAAVVVEAAAALVISQYMPW